jgi:hypothetical protein
VGRFRIRSFKRARQTGSHPAALSGDALHDYHYHSYTTQGEFVSIHERLIIAPGWGRVSQGNLETGTSVEEGAVIGRLLEGGKETPLTTSWEGAFAGWLVQEGDRVPPGRAIARLRLAEA